MLKLTPPILLASVLVIAVVSTEAQDKCPVKFGKVSPEDFNQPPSSIDSNANAVIIADIGTSEFEGNSKGWFSLIFRHTKRIKILNKNGFDAANVEIPLYSSNNNAEETLEKVKAITYNLENGKVVETKLDEKSIFKDVIRKGLVVRKFTFPAVKEGSIIEYSYTVNSEFFYLRGWEFQGEYPCHWSEYQVSIPEFFNYVTLSQGYRQFDIRKNSSSNQTYNIRFNGSSVSSMEGGSLSGQVNTTRWVMKEVTPLKEEAFTSTLDNHTSKIEFQLSRIQFPNQIPQEVMGTWGKVNEELLKDEEFGVPLQRNNNWMDDDMKVITGTATDALDKAHKIYTYVRDNFTCTQHSGKYLTNTLKNIMKARNGSVADINLLLCAMLRHENIEAAPVLIGTRSHGYTHEIYPLMSKFNYVIVEAIVDGKACYLDATQPGIGFGRLPVECYNGHARVVGNTMRPVYFFPDSLVEKKFTTVIIRNDDKGGLMGRLSSNDGYFESLRVRQKVKEKGEAAFFKEVSTAFTGNINISETGIDSLKRLEDPVNVHYDFKMDLGGEEDIIYFNPLLKEGYKENIFKAAERKYPVEMPYTIDETYILNMEIPAGYVVEELPKSAKTTFNDTEGYFEYLVAKDNERIQLRTRVVIRKATFMPEDYEPLRGFFGYIVKKHNEQIVLKKKK